MIAWRVCREPFADLTGEGARLYGGRWNSVGRAVVYTADSAALALLEVRVHLDLPPSLLPDDYLLLSVDLGTERVEVQPSIPDDPVAFGDAWLRSRRSACLRVPSVLVPENTNILINPAHPDAEALAIASRRPFRFDERLWRGI